MRARPPTRLAAARGVALAAALLCLGSGGWGADDPETAAASAPPRAEAGDADCAREVALRVQAHYEGVDDLRARFAQTTERVALGSAAGGLLETRGEVVFAKPGRMRWSYREPEPSLVVSDGETLWVYDPAAREVQQLPLGPGFLSGAAIQFLLGRGRLLEEFRVEARACDSTPIELRLTPRAEALYEHLEVRADPATGAIDETVVTDLLGNRTTVAFDDVRTNTHPDPELFRFDAPEGTRVLELPPVAPP